MPYWRYFYIVQNLTEILKKKQEAEEDARTGQSQHHNSGDMHKNMQNQMNKYNKGVSSPKLPSMPKFPSMPNIKI